MNYATLFRPIALPVSVLALSVALPAPGFAQPTRLSAAFGNTVVSTYPDGRQSRLWLNADQTYQLRGRRGGMSSGTWRLSGERLCLRQRRPASIPISICRPVPQVRLGSQWTDTAQGGVRITLRLVPGR